MKSRMATEVQLEIGLGLVIFSQVGLRGFDKNAKILRVLFFSLGSCAERVGVSSLQNQNRNNFTNAVNL